MAAYVATDYWVSGYAEGDDGAVYEDTAPVTVRSTVTTTRVGSRTTPINAGYLGNVTSSPRGIPPR